jgi:ferredoxin-type protein NapH
MKSKFYNKLSKYRVITQTVSFLFILLIPVLVSLGFREVIGSYYSFTIFGLEIADPAVSLQTILLKKEVFLPIIIAIIIPIIVALIFGKVFCSWVCPYTAIQDFIDSIIKRVSKKKNIFADGINPKPIWYWSILGFLTLLILVFAFPVFTFLSYPGIISTNIYYLFIGVALSFELFIVALVLVLELNFSKRIWCKYICPVGATLAIFRSSRTMQIVYNEEECDCLGTISPCKISCPLGLDPKEKNLYPYCYNCGKCLKMCEKTGNGALKFGFKKTNNSLK